MKSFAALVVFATVALAQTNPLIPSGISATCTSFLTTLNTDSSLAACTAPLVSASAKYGPSSNSTPSAADIDSTLETLCSASSTCSDSSIRSLLGKFYAQCGPELTSSPNADVIRTYDVLYVISPLKTAVCSKSDSGSYCGAGTPANSTTARIATEGGIPTKSLYTAIGGTAKRDTTQVALIPNVTTYRDNNLVFLFLQPSLSSAELCTTCTRDILNAYTTFESSVAYAPGLASSPLLGGQTDLLNGVQSTCGTSFLSGSVQAAGGLSGGVASSTGAAPRSVDGPVALVGSVLAAVAVGIFTSL
ncbi:hypothetical protein FA95DRAFT_1612398 [Auriscalpium vulgare]|uniref:Uncharacterized protein n=1 Tax=Auriscalpium vulgare TaxID=40419 RepID=A0ACB8R6B8_9AGAM|nr:hypothetical protein FA95DRAFT_1612398 [Auriscalpium vulgare]